MIRHLSLAGVALLAFAGSMALAQAPMDSETRDLIERLRPADQQTRGIRRPGADAGPATPPNAPILVPAAPEPSPAAPAPSFAAPAPTPATPAPAALPSVTSDPRPPTPVARDTTAPPGLSAVSITVNFATGSHAISPEAAQALAALGRALASPELTPFRFRIEGHTDTVGDAGLNMALSQRRAEAVRDYLTKGFPIAPFRLVAVGFGEGQLLVPTGDNAAEPRNRRVQVVNLGG